MTATSAPTIAPEGSRAEAEALELGRNRTLAEEIQDLSREETISDELAQLKARMKSGKESAERIGERRGPGRVRQRAAL